MNEGMVVNDRPSLRFSKKRKVGVLFFKNDYQSRRKLCTLYIMREDQMQR